jgi:hypothetical protein
MKPNRIQVWSCIIALTCIIAFPANSAEFKKGNKVWSKHYETPLLSEPSPLAAVLLTVGFAEKLSVRETKGKWLRVKSDNGAGWVFSGNIATEKPSVAPGAGLTTLDASQTDTVAAARPLTPAAEEYAERHDATDAQADIDWLDAEASTVTEPEVIAYMVANQKGEYQE